MDWLAAFRARYPQFVDVPDATVTTYINDALMEVDEEVWGDLYERGVLALTCHYLTLQGLGTNPAMGGIASKMVGDVLVVFKPKVPETLNDDWYTQTVCGAEFLRLSMSLGAGVLVIPSKFP